MSVENNDKKENSIPMDITDGIEEILDDIPEEKRKIVEQTMIAGISMISQNSPDTAIAKKITSEHIDKFFDMQEKGMDYQYKDTKSKRIFISVLVIIVLIVLIVLVVLLKNNTDVLIQLVTPIISLVVGAFGGYGYGKSKRDDD